MRTLQRARGFLFLLVICLTVDVSVSLALGDRINRTLAVRDGDTLVSAGGRFELGFFPLPAPGRPRNRYVGIWFRGINSGHIVWVANRQVPLNDPGGILMFGESGKLIIEDSAGVVVWQSSMGAGGVNNPVAQLLDTGNLIIREGAGGDSSNFASDYLWQSFNEPGDTLIPGMRLGVNRSKGLKMELTSWKSSDDPSIGKYRFRLEPGLLPSLTLLEGTTVKYNTGFWNGRRFSGIPDSLFMQSNKYIFVSGEDAYYYSFEPIRLSDAIAKLVLHPSGTVSRLTWNARSKSWIVFLTGPADDCDVFGACGSYGFCNLTTVSVCHCPHGFHPRSEHNWSQGDTSGGCAHDATLQCGVDEGFLTLRGVKLPDTKNMRLFVDMGLDVCRRTCLSDCSCTAYARTEIQGGRSGCLTWSGELLDIKTVVNGPEDLYLRVPAAFADPAPEIKLNSRRSRAPLIVTTVSVALHLLLCAGATGIRIVKKKMKKKKKKKMSTVSLRTSTTSALESGVWKRVSSSFNVFGKDAGLPAIDFEIIAWATENFSPSNKVGEGGFGAVYKGVLEDGQEIAVKRLSWTSPQGINEFINETELIANLQHKNLVRLIGYCVYGDERMLIYEYMRNTSLDSFIFDESKRALLDWNTRFRIIEGIAKGLTYLHHDSRYKIIHRDLKASNVLLDGDMNPKISDFGTARILGVDQSTAKTRRVIGTYGYMAPEYAISGTISIKSDVFSFGVLTLEVLGGARNRGTVDKEVSHFNLISYAWKLWQEGKCLEFFDATVAIPSVQVPQMLRCMHIALLCSQEVAVDRPVMSSVVMMLCNENFPLPQPKRPAFLILAGPDAANATYRQEYTNSEQTVTILVGR